MIDARRATTVIEGNDPDAQRDPLTGPHSPATVPDDADWSNIDGPDPVRHRPEADAYCASTAETDTDTDDEFADVPDDVLDAAEVASMAIIGNYRQQRPLVALRG